MKKLLLLSIVAVFLTTSVFASPKGNLSGYIITKKNERIEGTIKVRNEIIDQVKIRFTSVNGKTTNFKPADIKEYGYEYNGEDQFGQTADITIRYVSKQAEDAPMIFAKTGVFMQVEEEGEVTLYNYYIQNNGDVENPVIRQYYVERHGSDQFVKLTKKNFVAMAGAFLSDHPEIPQNLGKLNHRFRHMNRVIQNYNKWTERHQTAGLPF